MQTLHYDFSNSGGQSPINEDWKHKWGGGGGGGER